MPPTKDSKFYKKSCVSQARKARTLYLYVKNVCKKLRALYAKSDRFTHLLVGIPSYSKYLEHIKTKHPEAIPKTQKEFFKEVMAQKYGAGSSKC